MLLIIPKIAKRSRLSKAFTQSTKDAKVEQNIYRNGLIFQAYISTSIDDVRETLPIIQIFHAREIHCCNNRKPIVCRPIEKTETEEMVDSDWKQKVLHNVCL